MSTRTKGNRAVRKAVKELEASGYLVSKVEASYKFARQRDCFDIFDLICLKPVGPVLFVQVTSNRPHIHKTYDAFAVKYPNIAIEQWVWKDYKGWSKYQY